MSKLFLKKTENPVKNENPDEFTQWWKITKRNGLLKFANFLGRHEQKLTRTHKKLLLGIFLSVMVCFSGNMIYKAIFSSFPKSDYQERPLTITRPRSIQVPDSLKQRLFRGQKKQ